MRPTPTPAMLTPSERHEREVERLKATNAALLEALEALTKAACPWIGFHAEITAASDAIAFARVSK